MRKSFLTGLTCCLTFIYLSPGYGLPTQHQFDTLPLNLNDFTSLNIIPHHRVKRDLSPVFKHVYVTKNGIVNFNKGHVGTQIDIVGSPQTSIEAVLAAAHYVSKMVKLMPDIIFKRLCNLASVGIFSAEEKLTVFPEYASYKNNNCGTSCVGECSRTCSSDGRKLEDLAGIGGYRAAILEDNVLCTPQDPYMHKENILVHEFTHTIHQFALNEDLKTAIFNAYLKARTNETWDLTSYAMSNHLEYFAEGAAVFFGVNVYSRQNTGGMNVCGNSYCETESSARNHLQTSDSSLYNILAHVFTSNHPEVASGLSLCPKQNIFQRILPILHI